MIIGLGVSAAAQFCAVVDGNGRLLTSALAGTGIFAVSPMAGNPPTSIPTIQWTLDGVDIPGATGVTLIVPEGPGGLAWYGTDSAGADVVSGMDVTIRVRPIGAVPAPVLDTFAISDDGEGTMSLSVDRDSTVYVWIGPTGTAPTAQQVRDGTGADVSLSQAVTPSAGSYDLTLPDTLDGTYRVAVVGQAGTGPLSNVLTVDAVAFDTTPPPVAADPAFASWFGDRLRTFGSSRTTPAPADTVTGDMLVLAYHGNGTLPAITPPAGFSAIGAVQLPSGFLSLFEGVATADGAGAYVITTAANAEHSGFMMRFDPGGTVGNFTTTSEGAGSPTFGSGTISGLSDGALVVKIGVNDGIGSALTLDGTDPTIFDTPSSGSASLGVSIGVGFETVSGTSSTAGVWGRGFVNSASALFSIQGT